MSHTISEILASDELLTEAAKKVFDFVDTDHSGHIDKKELGEALNKVAHEAGLPPLSSDDIAEALAAADNDGSGTLELNEFKDLVYQILDAINSKAPA